MHDKKQVNFLLDDHIKKRHEFCGKSKISSFCPPGRWRSCIEECEGLLYSLSIESDAKLGQKVVQSFQSVSRPCRSSLSSRPSRLKGKPVVKGKFFEELPS